MTLVGSPGADRAQVDGRGCVAPTAAGWRVDWWIGAEDRWRRAAEDVTVRQSLVDAAPVVETAMRVPGGDAVQRVYGADAAGTVVVEIENASAVPFVAAIVVGPAPTGHLRSLAVDGTKLRIDRNGAVTLPRSPGRWAVGPTTDAVFDQVRRGDAGQGVFPASTDRSGRLVGALLYPLAHRATLRLALGAGADLPALPGAGEVARSWTAQLQRGMRVELPDPGLTDAVHAARAALLIAGTDIAALEDWGFDHEAADAWRRASWRERRRARHRHQRPARWDDVQDVRRHGDAGPFLLDLRSLLVHETGRGVDVLTDLPPDWLGRDLEVHQAPTRAAGAVSYAVRWHGERPALLWDCEQATTLRAPGVDPSWSTGERAGEALLAPVGAYASVRGDST